MLRSFLLITALATLLVPSARAERLLVCEAETVFVIKDLVVTARRHVYLFDRDKHEFRLHPELDDKAKVKCVCVNPASGQTAFVQATESWWSDTVGLLAPAGRIHMPGERLYKVRWLPPGDAKNESK